MLKSTGVLATEISPEIDSQKIFAKVKESSKYFYQNKIALERGEFPFHVFFADDVNGEGYLVNGGPGGKYRMADVDLFVFVGNHEIKIT